MTELKPCGSANKGTLGNADIIDCLLIVVDDEVIFSQVAISPAQTPFFSQAAELIKAGFEFICRIEGRNFFGKRK
jgi:hypothetical protein